MPQQAAASTALVVDAVVRNGKVAIVDEFQYRLRVTRQAAKWGDGCVLKIRIEPEDEAWRYGDMKHYRGHLLKPFADKAGYTEAEAHALLKDECLPDDGRTSLTQLNRDEFTAFLESVSSYIRDHYPDAWEDCAAAMALYEGQQRRSA